MINQNRRTHFPHDSDQLYLSKFCRTFFLGFFN